MGIQSSSEHAHVSVMLAHEGPGVLIDNDRPVGLKGVSKKGPRRLF